MLKLPVYTTPCCPDLTKVQKLSNVYHNQDEIENVLIENDFHCPNCGKDDIYIDSLVHAESLEKELQEFIESKEGEIGMKDPSKRSLEEVANDENGVDVKKQNCKRTTSLISLWIEWCIL